MFIQNLYCKIQVIAITVNPNFKLKLIFCPLFQILNIIKNISFIHIENNINNAI